MTERRMLDALPVHPVPQDAIAPTIEITGKLEQPVSLAPEDLARFRQTTLTEDFDCTEGWTVPGQTWSGVLVGDILDSLQVDKDASWIEFGSGDFSFSSPLADARTALVALRLNEEPLSSVHGGPCRLYLPGEACYTSIKWLDRIIVSEQPGANRAREIAEKRLQRQES